MVGHVALVTQDLLVWAVLSPTHRAGTVLALATRVILAPVTVRLLRACYTLPVALPRLSPGLDTEDLIHKLDFDLLRCIR